MSSFYYKQEYSNYIENETYCLMKAASEYLKNFRELELICQKESVIDLRLHEYPFIFPFMCETPTCSSVIYYLFRVYFLSKYDVSSVKHEYNGIPMRNISKCKFYIFGSLGINNNIYVCR